MNILRLLFELFLLYMLYKLVFDFIIPVYKASTRMREQVRNMRQKMQEQQQEPSSHVQNDQPGSNSSQSVDKEYIDFEEVK